MPPTVASTDRLHVRRVGDSEATGIDSIEQSLKQDVEFGNFFEDKQTIVQRSAAGQSSAQVL